MAQFTITVNEQSNQAPNQIGNLDLSLDYNEEYTFTLADFTTNTVPQYQDPEGDALFSVKVVTLPTVGTLLNDGNPVIVLDEITSAEISGSLLTYQADPADTDGYVDVDFTFDISDAGSGTFSGLTPGIVTFTVGEQINQPPSAVGDNADTIEYGESIIFTVANFTTETTPVYADPEGDSADVLRILSLPSAGTLTFNGTDVLIYDEIDFSDIALGKLVYTADSEDTSSYAVDFNFSIKDTGSDIFTT